MLGALRADFRNVSCLMLRNKGAGWNLSIRATLDLSRLGGAHLAVTPSNCTACSERAVEIAWAATPDHRYFAEALGILNEDADLVADKPMPT